MRIIKSIGIIVLSVFIGHFTYAQDGATKAVISKYKLPVNNDSLAFDIVYNKAWQLFESDINNVLPLLNTMRYFNGRMQNKTNKVFYKGMLYNTLGKYYYLIDHYDSSIFYFEKSISVLKKDSSSKLFSYHHVYYLPSYYNNLALVYDEIGFYENAIHYQYLSLKEVEKIWKHDTTVVPLNQLYITDFVELAMMYSNINDTAKSISLFEKGLQLAQRSKSEEIIHYSEFNYAIFLIDIDSLKRGGDYLDSSLKYYKKNSLNYNLIVGYANKALLYKKQHYNDKAKALLNRAYLLSDSLGFEELHQQIMYQQFYLYYDLKEYNKALNIVNSYLKVNRTIDIELSNLCSAMADIYRSRNNTAKEFYYLNKAFDISDSIFQADRISKAEIFNSKYELDKVNYKNEKLIDRNKKLDEFIVKQRFNNRVILALLFIVSVFAYIIYLSFRSKSKKNKEIAIINAELNKKTQELTNSNQMLEKIFSVISHDLKGPIGTADVFFDYLNDESANISAQERNEYINTIGKSVKSTHILLEEILNWSRNRLGKKVAIIEVDLRWMVNNIFKSLDDTIHTKDILFNNDVPQLTKIKTDKGYLNIILRNLISNAIKFTNPGGEIKVSCVNVQGKNIISVMDTGIGMSKEFVQNLLKSSSFQSTEGTNKERGFGMGIMICKELTDSLGGNIRIDSERGQGTTVYIELPV